MRLGGFAHINTAECRFSLMKRAVFGAHHSISEAHLPRYLVEWDFKWNTRKLKTGNVRRSRSKARKVSVSRIVSLVKPRMRKQEARRFLAWRRRYGRK